MITPETRIAIEMLRAEPSADNDRLIRLAEAGKLNLGMVDLVGSSIPFLRDMKTKWDQAADDAEASNPHVAGHYRDVSRNITALMQECAELEGARISFGGQKIN